MTTPTRFRPVEHDPELPAERRHECFCGHSFRQTLVEVEGRTDLDALVEKRRLYIPLRCPSCSRAKIREMASQ